MSELENNSNLNDEQSKDGSDSDNSTVNTEYTEVPLHENTLYQVLSTFFETEDGDNITTILSNINENIQVQNKILNHIAKSFENMQISSIDENSTVQNSDNEDEDEDEDENNDNNSEN